MYKIFFFKKNFVGGNRRFVNYTKERFYEGSLISLFSQTIAVIKFIQRMKILFGNIFPLEIK